MDGLDELKIENRAEHKMLTEKIKNIGIVNKALLGILVALFAVMLSVLFSIREYSKESFNVRVETLNVTSGLIKTINNNVKMIKTNKASIENVTKKVSNIEKKIGVY